MQQNIQIQCADSYLLSASCFTPQKPPQGAVMIGPATGIKRQFYNHFASYLAEQGYGVVTYDNRGIGESLTGDIKASGASLQLWGEQDMPAVLTWLQQTFPDTKYHLVGHSAGGQLVGLMPNAMQLSTIFNFASSSGQLRNMPLGFRFSAHFFMNFYIPLFNTLLGYTPAQWVGMGQPLPKQVANQWRQWCNGEGYVKTGFGKTITQHYYNELTFPAMWVNATDDAIATDTNVEDMIRVFPNILAKTVSLDPKEYGLSELGHMKFFSRQSRMLWQYCVEWLNKHS